MLDTCISSVCTGCNKIRFLRGKNLRFLVSILPNLVVFYHFLYIIKENYILKFCSCNKNIFFKFSFQQKQLQHCQDLSLFAQNRDTYCRYTAGFTVISKISEIRELSKNLKNSLIFTKNQRTG